MIVFLLYGVDVGASGGDFDDDVDCVSCVWW